jgi:hypothetical protein
MTQQDAALERAKKHVKEVRDFYYHLMTFVLVNAMLVFIDLRVDAGQTVLGLDWAYWVIFGWGFGIAGHAISVFFGDHKVQKVYEQGKNG